MGLDLKVYKNIKESTEEDYDFYAFVPIEEWEYKIKNIKKDQYYTGDRDYSVDLGYSYSTHYYFRQKLLELTGSDKYLNKEKTEILWDDLTSDIPFYELIYFSDCEGCLDYEISEILYNQFVEYYDIAKEKLDSILFKKI